MIKKHILVIPSWYPSSYHPIVGIFFKEQSEVLAKNNNKVGVIAIQPIALRTMFSFKKVDLFFKKNMENDVITYKIQYPEVPKLFKIKEEIKLFIFKKLFNQYIKSNGLPDIIHLHSFFHGNLAIWIKQKYKIPYIITEHYSGFSRNILKKEEIELSKEVFKNSNYNIAVSSQFKKLMEEKTKCIFDYIPNTVNIDFFNCNKIFRNTNNFNFINMASLNTNKNQFMLIEAFNKNFQDNKNITLTIVGDGVEYKNLRNLIENLKLSNQIKLYGKASREEVKHLLSRSNIFVLSSKYETFGVVLIEAMACGLPVVATKCGGPESIIVNEKIGILCEIETDSIANAMLTLYNKYSNYDRKHIRDYIVDNFSEQAVYLKLNNVYDNILGYK